VKIETKSKHGKIYTRDIKSDYFKSYVKNDEIRLDYETGIPFFVILDKYAIHACEVKRRASLYGWVRARVLYSLQETIDYIIRLKQIRNQGFPAAVKIEDNLTHSINNYNNNTTEKITKRCFDLLYPNANKHCVNCNRRLSFSTFDTGYGSYKGKQVCSKCINSKYTRTGGYSKISQKLFWMIYSELTPDERKSCKFAELNGERVVSTKQYYNVNQSINKTQYRLDFVVGSKNIEYDCKRYHTEDKDKIRDSFLFEYKHFDILRVDHDEFLSNPGEVVSKCVKFVRL
jgi:very-short-patch-repair endonuclease